MLYESAAGDVLGHPPDPFENEKFIIKLADFMVSTNGCGHLVFPYYASNSHTYCLVHDHQLYLLI